MCEFLLQAAHATFTSMQPNQVHTVMHECMPVHARCPSTDEECTLVEHACTRLPETEAECMLAHASALSREPSTEPEADCAPDRACTPPEDPDTCTRSVLDPDPKHECIHACTPPHDAEADCMPSHRQAPAHNPEASHDMLLRACTQSPPTDAEADFAPEHACAVPVDPNNLAAECMPQCERTPSTEPDVGSSPVHACMNVLAESPTPDSKRPADRHGDAAGRPLKIVKHEPGVATRLLFTGYTGSVTCNYNCNCKRKCK
jgi:hypothetical protein